MSDINRYIDIRSKLAGVSLTFPSESSAPNGSGVAQPDQPLDDPGPLLSDVATSGVGVDPQAPNEAKENVAAGPSNSVTPSTSEQQGPRTADGSSTERPVSQKLDQDGFGNVLCGCYNMQKC